MFEKIIPPAKGSSSQVSREARKLLFVVFRFLAGIAVLGFLVIPVWGAVQIALCIGAFVLAGVCYAISECFHDEDET